VASPRLRSEAPFALAAPIAAAIAYFPVVVVPYAFMDDYAVLAWNKGLEPAFAYSTAASFGRPLHAAALDGLFSLAPDLDGLRVVRLLALLGVMGLTLLVYYALRRAAFPRLLAAGACVSIATLVSTQVYVSWAAIAEAPYVCALAGLAALRLRPTWRGRAEAAALLLVALLTYQPAAMFFWVFVAIDVLRPGRHLRDAARAFAESIGVGAAAMFCAYAAVRIGVHFWGGTLAGRTTLVHDVAGKVRWFWNEPIVNGLALFNPNPAESVSLAVAIVAAAGLLLLHAESGRAAAGFLGLACCFVPLAYIPNLAIAENLASYRSIGALASLLCVYVWLGLWGILRTRSPLRIALAALVGFVLLAVVVLPLLQPSRPISLRSFDTWPELLSLVAVCGLLAAAAAVPRAAVPAAAVVAGVLLVGGVVVAARDVASLVIEPQSKELELMRARIDRAARKVVFVKPDGSDSVAPLVRYDELGPPSTYFPWVPPPAVDLLVREHGGSKPHLDVYASDQIREARNRPGLLVDMRALERERGGWRLWSIASARRP
jgi:hypothetical protein